MIASSSKPPATLMLARLVDAGRFRWDAPITQERACCGTSSATYVFEAVD